MLSRLFSSDRSEDQFRAQADDMKLPAVGSDATRLEFGLFDKFGGRAFAKDEVSVAIESPGAVVEKIRFSWKTEAVWLKTLAGQSSQVSVEATHSLLGEASV
jgi:hypothetical protein